MIYLNLGCGDRWHPDWTNIDIVAKGESIINHDLTQGIPFPDASFNMIYHSHVLEHFPKMEAETFLRECYRVLKPRGVLRVAVPDLEQITRTYLTALEHASRGLKEWVSNYEWIMLEMYDMAVRNDSGGQMSTYLSQADIVDDFVLKRCGIPIKAWQEQIHQHNRQMPLSVSENHTQGFLKNIYRFFRYPAYRRELILVSILGKEYRALQIGRLRQSGELHQWMYDRYSLAILLEKSGLENIVQRSATDSYIPNWNSFNLDTEPDGTVYKPDSLFMEAIKLPD
ncbi:MAG: methyltransferase domain-containing protein [Goleter apudmare HA4340-LM2]|jgi:predicted SAM-dependent methyltransferase|nr:methyltransferase domain-containing protein [Goleter apudmare HA4340-LM2]